MVRSSIFVVFSHPFPTFFLYIALTLLKKRLISTLTLRFPTFASIHCAHSVEETPNQHPNIKRRDTKLMSIDDTSAVSDAKLYTLQTTIPCNHRASLSEFTFFHLRLQLCPHCHLGDKTVVLDHIKLYVLQTLPCNHRESLSEFNFLVHHRIRSFTCGFKIILTAISEIKPLC